MTQVHGTLLIGWFIFCWDLVCLALGWLPFSASAGIFLQLVFTPCSSSQEPPPCWGQGPRPGPGRSCSFLSVTQGRGRGTDSHRRANGGPAAPSLLSPQERGGDRDKFCATWAPQSCYKHRTPQGRATTWLQWSFLFFNPGGIKDKCKHWALIQCQVLPFVIFA